MFCDYAYYLAFLARNVRVQMSGCRDVEINNGVKMDLKKLNSYALKEHLKTKNWEKIEEMLPAAEVAGVSAGQLKKTWFALGQHQKEDDKLVSALVSFSSARKHDLDNSSILTEILDCLSGFIDRFEDKFSREDLLHLEYGLDRLYSFQKTRPNKEDENLRRAKELLTRIRYKKEDAPSKRETPATPYVFRVYAALHPDMTFEEVKVEFARVVAPLIRKKLSANEKQSSKPKEKKSEKKKRKK
jgi:hypothetical protein